MSPEATLLLWRRGLSRGSLDALAQPTTLFPQLLQQQRHLQQPARSCSAFHSRHFSPMTYSPCRRLARRHVPLRPFSADATVNQMKSALVCPGKATNASRKAAWILVHSYYTGSMTHCSGCCRARAYCATCAIRVDAKSRGYTPQMPRPS